MKTIDSPKSTQNYRVVHIHGAHQSSPKKIKRILLIDDEPQELFILREALLEIDADVSVEYINDLDIAVNQNFSESDVIFLDLKMPKFDGYELLENIRNAQGEIPIIIYSATKNGTKIDRAYELGANLFLTKPPDFEGLVNAIKSILQFNWTKPEQVKNTFFINGRHLPFCFS